MRLDALAAALDTSECDRCHGTGAFRRGNAPAFCIHCRRTEPYLDRILDDGTDRERWLRRHGDLVTASRAATLAKPESVDKYLLAALRDGQFHGNSYTEQGHRWEPMMLAWANIPQNLALIHAPQEPGFAATPDGIGDRLAECKVKHNRVVTGPSLGEFRQVAWQFLCLPEFDTLDWLWMEVDQHGEPFHEEPKIVQLHRSDPKIVDLTARILPIATDLLARLRAARQLERELAA